MRTRTNFGTAALLAAFTMVIGSAQEATERLYQEIRQNHLAALRLSIDKSNVNSADQRGNTPLLDAAAFGSLDAMRLLISKGANVNAANAFGATPLMLAVTEPEKVRLLVSSGANVNAQSKMGRTPLMLAAAHDGNSGTVKLLLDHGADVKARDGMQSTALVSAASAGDFASLQMLIAKGASVNEKDMSGVTALHNAAMNGNLEAVRFLIARGADVNAAIGVYGPPTVKNGNIALGNLTPLMMAAAFSGPEVTKALIDAGANVNAQDIRGMTPLMFAVATDRADVRTVRYLLDAGTDQSKKTRDGETAADWARKYNTPAILKTFGIDHASAPQHTLLANVSAIPLPDAREGASKAIGLMQRASVTFQTEGGCVSCHAQNLTGVAVTAARLNHVAVDEKAATELLKSVNLQFKSFEQGLLQRMDGPTPDLLLYAVFQMSEQGAPADRTVDAMIHNIAAQQRTQGNWSFGGIARAPMEDGDFGRTALAIRALRAYGPAGRKAGFARRIERAAHWLAQATPITTEDLVMQSLGLKWAGAARPEAARELVELQREDGGWGQTPSLGSDAYATGQVLYALHELGLRTTDPAYQGGIRFLLRTQAADGSWFVKSRVPKLQPYFESGFPYGHDQWISSAGTAWAAIALSYAAGEQEVAGGRRTGY